MEPEAYRMGHSPFLGLTIYLDSRPLIPRVETEWWTEKAVARGGRKNDASVLSVLDLCAGSGAIGCAILKYVPNAKVYFGEIDPAHEATIWKNIRENHLDESRAEVRIGDLFALFGDLQFDFILSNPPYVPEGRKLPAIVQDFEPALALRAGNDGLAVIRRIIAELSRHLRRGGEAWIECDIANIEDAKELAESAGLSASILPDQYERPRVLCVLHSPS